MNAFSGLPKDAVTKYADDPDLRTRVLRPYRERCRYLFSADVHANGEMVAATCEFVIEESCYIDSTGHFNAVEFNLCYNQTAYYLIARSVRDQLLPVFRGWTLDDFLERQLSDVLIVDFHSRFRRAIRGGKFQGSLTFDRARLRVGQGKAPLVLIESYCRFWDDDGGKCDGDVLLALTNPPAAAIR